MECLLRGPRENENVELTRSHVMAIDIRSRGEYVPKHILDSDQVIEVIWFPGLKLQNELKALRHGKAPALVHAPSPIPRETYWESPGQAALST
jgi:hypothetical protein